MDVVDDVIKDWTPRRANTFEKLCLSMGSTCFFYFNFAHYGATERERERESVGAKRGMEDGNQREEKKRMRLRGRRVEAAEVKCRE